MRYVVCTAGIAEDGCYSYSHDITATLFRLFIRICIQCRNCKGLRGLIQKESLGSTHHQITEMIHEGVHSNPYSWSVIEIQEETGTRKMQEKPLTPGALDLIQPGHRGPG